MKVFKVIYIRYFVLSSGNIFRTPGPGPGLQGYPGADFSNYGPMYSSYYSAAKHGAAPAGTSPGPAAGAVSANQVVG